MSESRTLGSNDLTIATERGTQEVARPLPLVDMSRQVAELRLELEGAASRVLASGRYILGPEVAAFEQELASFLSVAHGVGVANGTDALVLSLRALGVGRGDEVIVPAYTFFATAEAVLLVGATPVFAEICEDTYCIDPLDVERRITPRTKAVIPVHLYGHPADMDPLVTIAEKHGLFVVEDNAQALGAEYKGRRTGTFGGAGCISFFPSKNLGAFGDAGAVVTADPQVAERIQMLRTHGWRDKYRPEWVGYNSRLDELQAAFLRVKLPHLAAWNERRRELAHAYDSLLSGFPVGLPTEVDGARHVYHLYVLRTKDRNVFREDLGKRGIASAVYYPVPLHLTEPCRPLGYKQGDFPVSETASRETVAIPLFPEMTTNELERVAIAVGQASTVRPSSLE